MQIYDISLRHALSLYGVPRIHNCIAMHNVHFKKQVNLFQRPLCDKAIDKAVHCNVTVLVVMLRVDVCIIPWNAHCGCLKVSLYLTFQLEVYKYNMEYGVYIAVDV